MASIGGMLGTKGGANGTGFNGPTGADIVNPTDPTQIKDAYGNVQNSMEAQRQLLAALQNQNGLQNQSQVYGQLQGIANGTGPNPAQAMLNQSTGQNVANQAALMAGQRGAGANAGLLARQAAQIGSGIQQNAAGQAATLQANQSLNAINSAGGLANTQAANQIGQVNANTSAAQSEQQALLNAQAAVNNAKVGMQSNINNVNGSLIGTGMQGQQKLIGGLMSGAGAAMGAEGGVVRHMADGGDASAFSGPQSRFGQFLNSQSSISSPDIGSSQVPADNSDALLKGGKDLGTGIKGMINKSKDSGTPMAGEPTMSVAPMAAARGGKVPAILSPGEKYLKPEEAREVAQGKANPSQVGKIIPGKPKYKGNNYANDVVPAELEEGGVVIPNSVMQSKDPVRGAADFVRKTLAKKKVKK